jgi:hypothetical protein
LNRLAVPTRGSSRGKGGSCERQDGIEMGAMNDDQTDASQLATLQAEHRLLDERIRALSAEPIGDQLEIARLKKRKLHLKDHIQMMVDANLPDIIA